jgi:hypothetical protein
MTGDSLFVTYHIAAVFLGYHWITVSQDTLKTPVALLQDISASLCPHCHSGGFARG